MVKIYLINKDYLEAFLNMTTLETVHSIHITPTEQYNVICEHSPMQAKIYSYAYRLFSGKIAPVSEQTLESSRIDVFSASERKHVRTYDMKNPISNEEQVLLESCFQVLLPDAECLFLSNRRFTLTTLVI